MSGARSDTWMPLYWGDYLRDTMHLRTEAHGAYLLAIADYWTKGGPLPDDDEYLMAVMRLDPEAFQRLKPTLKKFFNVDNGFWRHSRIDSELEKAKRITKARQSAGKMGGKKSAKSRAKTKQTGKQKATPSQPQLQDSVSFAKAQETDDMTSSKLIYSLGKKLLGKADKPPGDPGSLITKWLGRYGEDAVLDALRACERKGTPDPVAYITGTLKKQNEPEVESFGGVRLREVS